MADEDDEFAEDILEQVQQAIADNDAVAFVNAVGKAIIEKEQEAPVEENSTKGFYAKILPPLPLESKHQLYPKPLPDGWMRYLHAGNLVWLCEEQRPVMVLFPWLPSKDGGNLPGRLLISKDISFPVGVPDFHADIQIREVDIEGRDGYGAQRLLPLAKYLPSRLVAHNNDDFLLMMQFAPVLYLMVDQNFHLQEFRKRAYKQRSDHLALQNRLVAEIHRREQQDQRLEALERKLRELEREKLKLETFRAQKGKSHGVRRRRIRRKRPLS